MNMLFPNQMEMVRNIPSKTSLPKFVTITLRTLVEGF